MKNENEIFDINRYKTHFKLIIWLDYLRFKNGAEKYREFESAIKKTPIDIQINGYKKIIRRVVNYRDNTAWLIKHSFTPIMEAQKKIHHIASELECNQNIHVQEYSKILFNLINKASKDIDRHYLKLKNKKNNRVTKEVKVIILHGLICSKGSWEDIEKLRLFFKVELPNWMKEHEIILPYSLYSIPTVKEEGSSWASVLKSKIHTSLKTKNRKMYDSLTKEDPNYYSEYLEYSYYVDYNKYKKK